MIFSCDKDVLSAALSMVQRAVALKSPLPALKGILLSVHQDHLEVKATDLEFGIRCMVKASVSEPGEIVLPAKLLTEFVRRLPAGKVELKTDGQQSMKVNITSGKINFDITGFAAEEFPRLPETGDDAAEFSISEGLLKEMLLQTEVAIARDETRRVLTGLLMENEDEKLKMVSTDGHRLAFRQADAGIKEDFKAIVPGKVVQELIKTLSDDEEEKVNISINKTDIIFELGGVVISSRLVEGKYPPYQQIIPTEFKTTAKVETKDLASALDRAEVIAREGANNLVKLSLAQGSVAINSVSPDVGVLDDSVDAEIRGEEIEIRFNVRLLLDCLKNIGSQQVNMDFTGPYSPCLVTPLNDNNCLHLVLPVRLQ